MVLINLELFSLCFIFLSAAFSLLGTEHIGICWLVFCFYFDHILPWGLLQAILHKGKEREKSS